MTKREIQICPACNKLQRSCGWTHTVNVVFARLISIRVVTGKQRMKKIKTILKNSNHCVGSLPLFIHHDRWSGFLIFSGGKLLESSRSDILLSGILLHSSISLERTCCASKSWFCFSFLVFIRLIPFLNEKNSNLSNKSK